MTVKLHFGDILDLEVDVIVNAANTDLQHGGGLAAAIVQAGGDSIQEESTKVAPCDLGSAIVTGAGRLSAGYVIHVPTVDHSSRRRATADEIESGTRTALTLARSLGARNVAFPLLGTGLGGLKAELVAAKMRKAMQLLVL